MSKDSNLHLSLDAAMDSYHGWLGDWVSVDEDALKEKREKMLESDFAFLRATFFRWIQQWQAGTKPHDTRSVHAAPSVLSVGDIHLENFGIWRDRDGRLAWGINDFDEACMLPYTQDLLRLAVSIRLASQPDATKDGPALGLDIEVSLEELLMGYQKAMQEGREAAKPIVLAEDNGWLHGIAQKQIQDASGFWKDVQKGKKADPITAEKVQEDAYNAVALLWPDPLPSPAADMPGLRWYSRRAGLGSLGRPRYALFGLWRGGLIAREAKALVPSAYYWASEERPIRYHLGQALSKTIRAPDPILRVVDQWLVRRIAPDCIKLETGELETMTQRQMLREMGRELANVHLGGTPLDIVAKIVVDLKRHNDDWLKDTSETLAESVRKDRATMLKSAKKPKQKAR